MVVVHAAPASTHPSESLCSCNDWPASPQFDEHRHQSQRPQTSSLVISIHSEKSANQSWSGRCAANCRLPLGKKSAFSLEDVTGSAQLLNFTRQLLEPLTLIRSQAWAHTRVDFFALPPCRALTEQPILGQWIRMHPTVRRHPLGILESNALHVHVLRALKRGALGFMTPTPPALSST